MREASGIPGASSPPSIVGGEPFLIGPPPMGVQRSQDALVVDLRGHVPGGVITRPGDFAGDAGAGPAPLRVFQASGPGGAAWYVGHCSTILNLLGTLFTGGGTFLDATQA